MAKKFSIRKLLFVGMLSIAGLFGASSVIINNTNKELSILEKANADSAPSVPSGLAEKVDGTWYQVVWYYVASEWENGSRYDDKSHHCYWTDKTGNDYIRFCDDARATKNTFSEVHGGGVVKLFLPTDATKIQFHSGRDSDKKRCYDRRVIDWQK